MPTFKPPFIRNFHPTGTLLVIIGIAGSILSLLWDIIYRQRTFSLQSIGPLKIAGMVAGLILTNFGIWIGFVLAARKRSVQANKALSHSRNHLGLLLPGVILTISGTGGMLLSLLWDVVSKGKPFDIDAIGPFKAAGILAGIILMAAGIILVFLGLRKFKVEEPEIFEALPEPPVGQNEIPFAIPAGQAIAPAGGGLPMEALPVEEANTVSLGKSN